MTEPAVRLLSLILENINEGVFTVDQTFRINFFNRAAEKITGFSRQEAIGKPCFEIFRANLCNTECMLKKTLATGQPITDAEVEILNQSGKKIPISVNTAVLWDDEGRMVGGVETFRDLGALDVLRQEIKKSHRFEDIVSKNHQMRDIFQILPDVAASDATVLIQGPSGSGKELMVRAIHNLSPRRRQPFVKVNCGAIPDTLLESELFGYVEGAFTGARRNKPGRFALAQGGTIFLDEIGDISPALQVKLLRVLQEKEFEPLGSTETVAVDLRVVAATHRELQQLVHEGKYRSDLFYRLKVMKIDIPLLRERREDIPLLVEHFVERLGLKMGKQIKGVTDEVLELLMQYDFPGNIRELENIIEHGFILCRDTTIDRSHLPKELIANTDENANRQNARQKALQDTEVRLIRELLHKHDGNRSKTATELGIDRSTLWRKMKSLGISSRF